ncbi:hypothetical protein [Promicromonospora sp. NPDC060271]|uniref:hypothetical protein n=1 Tax=Promicromonospora sp. NPDC060271 TaxID=3347089 RepID=UPI003663E150
MDAASIPGHGAVQGFMEYAADTFEAVGVAIRGAHVLVDTADLMRHYRSAGAKVDPVDQELHDAAVPARDSIAGDFAILHGHALMGAWGALEACIDDVAIDWLTETEGACALSATNTLKVSLGDYLALKGDARWPWLLDQIKRAQSSSLKSGVGQFETVLSAVGLGGGVDPHIRTAIHYTKAIRNVIAHKGGRVDARFVEACPDLGLTEGERLSVTSKQFLAGLTAMLAYSGAVYERSRVLAGAGARPPRLPWWVEDLASLPAAFTTSGAARRGSKADSPDLDRTA